MFRSTIRKLNSQISNKIICYNEILGQYVRPMWQIETKSTILNSETEEPEVTTNKKWLCLSMQNSTSPKRAKMAQYMTLYQIPQTDGMIREDLMTHLYASSHDSIEGFDVVAEDDLRVTENKQDDFANPTLGCGSEENLTEDLIGPENLSEETPTENEDDDENSTITIPSKFKAWKQSCPIFNSTNFEQKFTFQDDNLEVQIFLYPYEKKNYTRSIDCFGKSDNPKPENIDVVEVDINNEVVYFRYRINTILKELPENSDDQAQLTVGPVIWTCKGITETEYSKVLADPIKNQTPTFKFLLQTDDVTVHNSVKLDATRKSAHFSYDLKLPTIDENSKEKIVYYDVQPLFVSKWQGLKEDSIPENTNFELMDYGVDGANDKKLMPGSSDRYFLPRVYSFPKFRIAFDDLKTF